MGMQFKLTVTANLSDGSEINDIDVPDTVTEAEIGNAAWKAACAAFADDDVWITSLVIVAVVA